MTTTAVLAFPIEEQLRKEQDAENKTQHLYKVNRTNALAFIKESVPQIFIHKAIDGALKTFDYILRKTVEIVRPNRNNPRKKKPRNPPPMNYKQLQMLNSTTLILFPLPI